jgi:hypothetical protein
VIFPYFFAQKNNPHPKSLKIEFRRTQISICRRTYILVLNAPPKQFEVINCGKQECRVIILDVRQDVHHLALLKILYGS